MNREKQPDRPLPLQPGRWPSPTTPRTRCPRSAAEPTLALPARAQPRPGMQCPKLAARPITPRFSISKATKRSSNQFSPSTQPRTTALGPRLSSDERSVITLRVAGIASLACDDQRQSDEHPEVPRGVSVSPRLVSGPNAAQPGVTPARPVPRPAAPPPGRTQSKVGLGFNEHVAPHEDTRSKIIPMGADEITAHALDHAKHGGTA